jgi:hypothetical protein
MMMRGGAGEFDGDAATGGWSGRRRNDEYDEEGGSYSMDRDNNSGSDDARPLDPLDEVMLLDNEYFESKALEGYDWVDQKMDPVQDYFARVFFECHKSKDGTYKTAIELSPHKRTQLPKTRSMSQLYSFMNDPQLRNSAPGSPGAELATQAWQVGLDHSNIFFYVVVYAVNLYLFLPMFA